MSRLSLFKEFLEVAAARKGRGLSVTKSLDVFCVNDKEGKEYARCRLSVSPEAGAVILWNMQVDPSSRKAGLQLGGMMTRAVAQFADDIGCREIDIMMVEKDGLSFWPYMGAAPGNGYDGFGQALSLVSSFNHIGAGEKEKLAYIDKQRTYGEELAWFRMTDKESPDVALNRQTVRAIGQQWYQGETMFMDLEKPAVRRRLALAT